MAQRILIVRLSAIGDTIHSLPLAAAIRAAMPDCYIGWVVEQAGAALVVDNPAVDWSYVLPKGWLKHPSLVVALRRALRAQRFDTAIDVQGLTKSAVAALLSGASRRIGFTRGEGRELAPILDNVLVAPVGVHAVEKTLSLLPAAGVPVPARPDFPLPPCPSADAEQIARTLDDERYARGYMLLGPWGSFAGKLWPLERFAQLADSFLDRTGLPSLMLGHGALERAAIENLAALHPASLQPAPDVSVAGVAELARRAAVFAGCDSFPMHMAAAVGCAAVGLFGITDPKRLGPWGALGHAVYARLTLPRSTRERRQLDNTNMRAISVDMVLESCLTMRSLAQSKAAAVIHG